MTTPTPNRIRGVLWLLPSLLLLLAACDSADPSDPGEPAEMAISGHVSTSEAFTADPNDEEPIHGATVTAAAIGANGQLQTIPGSTTTDERGNFVLTVERHTGPILLQAETEEGTRLSAVIERGGASSPAETAVHPAPPLNVQSTIVAEVFLEARSEFSGVLPADALFHVDANTSAHIDAGDLSVEAVADAVGAAAAAEAAFAGNAFPGFDADAIEDARTEAYRDLRNELAGAETADQRWLALDNFFDTYTGAYAGADVSPLVTGRSATVGARAAQHFAGTVGDEAGFALTRNARLAAAIASAQAVEAEFEAVDAGPSTMQALVAARTQLVDALRDATTTAEMDEARAAYRTTVQSQLAAQLGVSEAVVAGGIEATAVAQAALDAAVSSATTAGAVAQAYGTYYTDAHLAASTVLGVEGVFGGNVVTMIAAY